MVQPGRTPLAGLLLMALVAATPGRAEEGTAAHAPAKDPDAHVAATDPNVQGQVTPTRPHPPKKRNQQRAQERPHTLASEGFPDRQVDWLRDRGLLLALDVAFYNQYASRVRSGGNNAATFAYQLFADYELHDFQDHGDLHLTGTFLGTIAADYNPATEPISDRVGSVSVLNGNVYPDAIALDELYLHWVSPEAKWVFALGRLDFSYFFDTNRAANDAYRQFVAYSLENDLSIPFPFYGGFGALGRWNASQNLYMMLGAGDASSHQRTPWESVGDGSWYEMLEAGWTVDMPKLGTGVYRLTGWHSDRGPGNGFGVGIDFDQNLATDWLIGFLRVGGGDSTQTDVPFAVSTGVALQAPFDRKNDETGIGVSWAKPSASPPNETLIEMYYRWALTERLSISPDLQIVVNPNENPDADVVVVGVARILWML